MNIAIRATFWVVTFGGLGYSMFMLAKPNEELLKKYDEDTKNTDIRQLANASIKVLKDAQDQNSDLNKKIEELLKR